MSATAAGERPWRFQAARYARLDQPSESFPLGEPSPRLRPAPPNSSSKAAAEVVLPWRCKQSFQRRRAGDASPAQGTPGQCAATRFRPSRCCVREAQAPSPTPSRHSASSHAMRRGKAQQAVGSNLEASTDPRAANNGRRADQDPPASGSAWAKTPSDGHGSSSTFRGSGAARMRKQLVADPLHGERAAASAPSPLAASRASGSRAPLCHR